eukprot:4636479-Heterocapsa_arctica.AAC.1
MNRTRTKEELGPVSRPISRLGARPDCNGPCMRPTISCCCRKPDSPGSRSGEQRAPQPEKVSMPFLPRQRTRLVE